MAKKPIDPPEYRQRALEPPENAEFRDMRDDWSFRKRVRKTVATYVGWTGGVGLGLWLFGKELIQAIAHWIGGGGASPQ